MMRKILLAITTIVLSACGVTSQPTSPTVEYIGLKMEATPTVLPTLTPTEVPPTALPVPTTDPNFFRDDFIEALDADWSWLREDPANWSLIQAPGSLMINVGDGYVPAHNNSNVLLRPAPSGNFLIQTRITFRPADNFQFAGLIIYQSDSNFVQAGREFCNATGCAGEGLYMDTYRKGVIVKPSIGQLYKDKYNNPLWIRLSRRANMYSFDASHDGNIWFLVGSQTSDIDPLQVGLVTGQRLRGEIIPAIFDYFEVRSLP